MPIEIANPDKILVEDMDTTFYIIVNDEDLQNNINQLEITFFNEETNKITIPYNGENIIEVPFHIPSVINIWIPIRIDWIFDKYRQTWFKNGKVVKEKYPSIWFTYQYYFYLYKKIPYSIVPSIITNKYNEELSKIDFQKSYKNIDASVDIDDHPTARYSFSWIEENRSDNDLSKKIQDLKDDFKDSISSNLNSTTCENTYKIIQDETESKDPYIDNIIYNIWCGYQCNNDFQCAGKIIAIHKKEKYFGEKEDKNRFYDFNFRLDSYTKSSDTVSAETQWDKFIKETELFAKNIILNSPPNMEYKESPDYSFNKWQLKLKIDYNYNYKNENHSSIYQQIMEWNKPIILKNKKKTNISKRKFKIKFQFPPKKTIRNTGIIDADYEYASVWFVVNIEWKAYDKNGKEITNISDEDLFADSEFVCLNSSKDSQIWFKKWTEIIQKKIQTLNSHTMSCDVISKWPRNYKWAYKPIEAVSIFIASEGYQKSNMIYHIIDVKDMTPDIELEKNPIKIQDNADSVFKFQIKSKIHKWMKCKIKIPYDRYSKYHIPILKISQKWSWDENLKHYLYFDCEANKDIPIRIKPPLMWNFDVLWELNKLSMVALQEGTAITFVGDLVWVWVEKQLNKLKKAKEQMQNIYRKWYKNAKVMQNVVKFDKAIKTLEKANDISTHTQNAIKAAQIKTNIEWHIKDSEEAIDIKESKGTLEKVADVWIWGINGLQTAVWAVVMAPQYIPIIWKSAAWKFITEKVGAKFVLAFNLMTNVWKWNLQYISKSEKIDRAKEKTLPIPIIIEVETKEWFVTQDIQIINVLYTWLDK